MARTPVQIPKAARDAWAAGDEVQAEAASGLKSRQLRNRLGPPGRGAAPAKPVAAVTPPQKLVQVKRAPKAPPAAPPSEPGSGAGAPADPRATAILAAVEEALVASPSLLDVPPEELVARMGETDPTEEEIAALDTRAEAAKVLIRFRRRLDRTPEVRLSTVGGRVLDAVARIEAIDKRRPAPPAEDEVTRRIVAVRDAAVARVGVLTSEAASKLARDRGALFVGLDIAPWLRVELQRRVDAMLGGTTT